MQKPFFYIVKISNPSYHEFPIIILPCPLVLNNGHVHYFQMSLKDNKFINKYEKIKFFAGFNFSYDKKFIINYFLNYLVFKNNIFTNCRMMINQ